MATKVEVVVLGLLAEEPMHGYDLLERFRQRGMGLWTELSRASVYQVLRRLERDGSVVGKAQEGREGPERRVFRITKPGRERLAAGVAEMAGDPAPSDAPGAVALGFAHVVPLAVARAAVDTRERTVRESLDAVRSEVGRTVSDRDGGSSISIEMLRRQEALAEAELAWLGAFRSSFGKTGR